MMSKRDKKRAMLPVRQFIVFEWFIPFKLPDATFQFAYGHVFAYLALTDIIIFRIAYTKCMYAVNGEHHNHFGIVHIKFLLEVQARLRKVICTIPVFL